MPYATTDYFREDFKGLFDADDILLKKYLIRASWGIDKLTFNRIRRHGVECLTEFQQVLIKDACCLQAQYLKDTQQSNNMGGMSSFSVNGISISMSEQKTTAGANNFDETAYSYLEQTGLMWRGVR